MGLDQLQAFMAAIRQLESGRNYKARGPMTKYGQATGAYQFLDSTWGGYGGYKHAADAPPEVQDRRAAELMTSYFNRFGDWRLVAIAWHAGPGSAAKEQNHPGYAASIGDVNMTSADYANRVMGIMGGNNPYGAGAAGGGASSYGSPDYGSGGFDAEAAKDRAKELYGYLGWFVDHPEIGPIILQAAEGGWTKERLQGALANTNWWRSTSERSRQWDALKASDRATWEAHIDETSISLMLKANQLGLSVSRGRAEQIADKALRYGWNDQELGIALAAEMRWRPGGPTASEQGGVGKLMQAVRKMAADAMVPVTKRQEWEWARRIVAGGADLDAVQATMSKLAKARFPWLAKEIDAGVTPGQFFAPYRNVIAQTLELNPDDINLMDTKWSPVLGIKDGSKTRTMTMGEAERYARMKPEWLTTKNAWSTVTEAAGDILQTFGMMG